MESWRIRLEIIRESVLSSMEECRSVETEGSSQACSKLRILTNRFIEETRAHVDKLSESDIEIYTRLQIQAEILSVKEQADHSRILVRPGSVQTKLPKLELPKFTGDVLKWNEFWDRFNSSVNEQNLCDADKLAYLQASLRGEALDTVRGLHTSNGNFAIAVQILKDRYGKPGFVLDAHYVALTKLKRASSVPKECIDTFNEIERHLRILESLGEDINNNHLRSLIVNKFPEELIYELRTRIRIEEETVKTIRKQLEHLITAKASTSGVQHPVTTIETLHIREKMRPERNNRRMFKEKLSNIRNDTCFITRDINTMRNKRMLKRKLSNSRNDTCFITQDKRKFKIKPCLFCEGNHFNDQCPKSIQERRLLLKNRCFICLKEGHTAKMCNMKKNCYHCKSNSHNSAICMRRDNKQVTKTLHLRTNVAKTTILQTAIIEVYDTQGKRAKCRALFDTGSQRSYITSEAARKLNVETTEQNVLTVYTFGSNQPNEIESPCTELEIKGITVKVNIIPYITENVEYPDPTLMNYKSISTIKLADDGSLGKRIDILIGNDYYHTFIFDDRIKYEENLYLINSAFGWIWSGIQRERDVKEELSVLTYVQTEPLQTTDTLLDQPLQRASIYKLWDLETLGISDCPKATRDDQAVEQFIKTVEFHDGRYWIKWPWCRQPTELQDNLGLCYGRLKGLLKRIDLPMLEKYNAVLQDQVEKNVIERVDEGIPVKHRVHYLPHHHIMKNRKLRIVYDASSKCKGQYSLNECLYRGPVLLENLVGLIIRFRSHRFSILADVEKAFLQLGIQETDRDVTRFLWIKDINEGPSEDNLLHLRFARVPFGIGCSPFLLAITLKHHFQTLNTPIGKQLSRDIYVDNLVSGGDSTEECLKLYNETKKTFESLSMRMRDWHTNNKHLQGVIDKELVGKNCEAVTILGINWHINQDILTLKFNTRNEKQESITKRSILAQISSVFDPCGYVSPLLIQPKLFLQDLWRKKIDWDTTLPPELQTEWKNISEQMEDIKKVEIPRWYGFKKQGNESEGKAELHCYVDASINAYATVVYIKIYDNEKIKISLLMSKTRLTPIKNRASHTIPRLELLGVLIGCRLINFIKTHLPTTVTHTFLWTDSQIAIQWINSRRVLPPFVSARVNEIRKSEDIEFRYTPTSLNPADIATRPCQNLTSQKLWFEGPPYLNKDKSTWPSNLSSQHAMIIRIDKEENKVIKELQKTHFPEEVKGKTTNLSRSLGLFLDDGILRCKGRFKRTDWPENQKYPILIPKETDFTRNLIDETHRKLYHVGVGQTLANVRLTYWIPSGRSQVQKILRRCKQCRKHGGGPYKNPPIAPLPKERVNISPPFTYTGTDYLGPLYTLNQKDNTMEKRWICLYTCLAVRAVHLEVVENLTAEECLLAMRRFIATRGLPHSILSDNATYYKLTAEVMENNYCIENKINWKFIPELAPWWGGAYERLVGLVKHCLKRTIDKHTLNDSQLATVIKEIEAVLNCRPLTTVGQEIEHVLTPDDFLRAGGLSTATDISEEAFLEPATDIKKNLIDGWKRGQDIIIGFNKMFINQYLLGLRERAAHVNLKEPRIVETASPRIGDIVQIKEDGPRIKWRVGRIETLIQSEDKHVRTAIVRLQDGQKLKRSITHLYPLEIYEEEQKQKQSDEQQNEGEQNETQQEEQEMDKSRKEPKENQRKGRLAANRARELIKKWTKELM